MATRRDYTNQFGAFTPTEVEALKNMGKKHLPKEEEIVVKKHKQILNEEDLKEMDKNRKKRKTFAEFVKEEIAKEEKEERVSQVDKVASKTNKAEYMKEYYKTHKEQFRANQKRYIERHREETYNPETKHTYVDIDKIRLVKEGQKIVGWYRPDNEHSGEPYENGYHDGWMDAKKFYKVGENGDDSEE